MNRRCLLFELGIYLKVAEAYIPPAPNFALRREGILDFETRDNFVIVTCECYQIFWRYMHAKYIRSLVFLKEIRKKKTFQAKYISTVKFLWCVLIKKRISAGIFPHALLYQ